MLHAFGDDERVAAQGNGDVVVPTAKAPTFEVVEPQLALQIFVDTFRAPPLHDQANELPLGDVLGQGGEEVIGGLFLAVAPFDEEPLGVAFRVGPRGRDSPEGEPGGKVLLRALSPGAASEAASGIDPEREVAHGGFRDLHDDPTLWPLHGVYAASRQQ